MASDLVEPPRWGHSCPCPLNRPPVETHWPLPCSDVFTFLLNAMNTQRSGQAHSLMAFPQRGLRCVTGILTTKQSRRNSSQGPFLVLPPSLCTHTKDCPCPDFWLPGSSPPAFKLPVNGVLSCPAPFSQPQACEATHMVG